MERERTEWKMEHLGGVKGGLETIGLPYYFGPNKFFFFNIGTNSNYSIEF